MRFGEVPTMQKVRIGILTAGIIAVSVALVATRIGPG
jgi:hypothetical protein